jgi:GMP synthase (glutamine-hydrolysing)
MSVMPGLRKPCPPLSPPLTGGYTGSMKTALALRHIAFEDLGSLDEILPDLGYSCEYIDIPLLAPEEIAGLDIIGPDLIVILGGPMSVNDGDRYPWLSAEMELVRQRLEVRRKTLGICLGAQFMASALGADVYPGAARQIGWGKLEISGAGAAAGLGPFGPAGKALALHWHGETFDLPDGATQLAGDRSYADQAFALGDWGIGLQFHVEARYPDLERWFAGHCHELSAEPAVDIRALREESIEYWKDSRRGAEWLMRSWLG